MLQRHPAAVQKIRAEHDAVLGSVKGTPELLKQDPHLLNKLHYTLAVVKETLRLWPAASTTRKGDPTFPSIHDPKTGEAFPTLGKGFDMIVWIPHYALHHSKRIWGENADGFEPERFLPENEAKLPPNAWRPFEKGPRNCIGQELALLEARLVLALTVRSFEFSSAFDALDELKGDGSAYAQDEGWRTGRQDLDGEEAYPILLGSAKPREGMPMRVREIL